MTAVVTAALVEPAPPDLPALAREWLAGRRAAPPGDIGWTALAWALKDVGDAAWMSEPARVCVAAEAAAALAERAPPAQRAEVLAVASWLGAIADLTRGRMSEAVERLDTAAAGLHAIGRPREAAQTQVPKVMALAVLGRHAEATACGERARQALRTAGDVLGAGKLSQNLGNLHVRCNAYGEALHCFREAAVLFARAGDREHSVMADLGAADARAALGEFDEALRLCERARRRAVLHALPVAAALAVESKALIELARGHYREALAGLEDARMRYLGLALPQHAATAEKQLADAYLELRLLPEAQALYTEALGRFDELQMPVEAAWAHVQAARACALAGGARAAVDAELDRASALFEAQQVPLGRSTILLVRAERALAAGDDVAALSSARAAAAGFEATGAADGALRARIVAAQALLSQQGAAEACAEFTAARRAAHALGATGLEAQASAGLGRAALACGDRAAAHEALGAAVDALEWQRAALPDDTLREAFFAEQLDPYEGLLRLALVEGDARIALQRIDDCRARTLDDRLRGSRAPAPPDAVVGSLRERLDWLYRRALRQREEGAAVGEAWREIAQLEAELLERTRRRRFAAADAGEALEAAPPRLHVEELAARLGGDDALVEYAALDGELLAVVLTSRAAVLHRRIATWSTVQEALRQLQFQVDALRHAAPLGRHGEQLAARARRRLQHLHALVWAPLAASLSEVERILVVPHGPLAGLPFAALDDGTRPLVERHLFATAPSARVACRTLARGGAAPRRALALGDTQRLPHAGPEALAAVQSYPEGCARIGATATRAALRDGAPDADVLHLACHGQFRNDNPAFSLLHLADGPLSVHDAASLRLRDATVVLGACDSARSAGGAGDEAVGFVRAFLEAGAGRVIASLWPVADERSAGPMARLHGALSEGLSPARALRAAQLEVLAAQPHPFHWAAYTVHGGW